MRLVILESPYAGRDAAETDRNIRYARACLHDCFKRGEAPIASHLLYTQPGVLRDEVPEERKLGIAAGLRWGGYAEASVVYINYGITAGMQHGINLAERLGRKVEERSLPSDWETTGDFGDGWAGGARS
jgi:hypothetical protein